MKYVISFLIITFARDQNPYKGGLTNEKGLEILPNSSMQEHMSS